MPEKFTIGKSSCLIFTQIYSNFKTVYLSL